MYLTSIAATPLALNETTSDGGSTALEATLLYTELSKHCMGARTFACAEFWTAFYKHTLTTLSQHTFSHTHTLSLSLFLSLAGMTRPGVVSQRRPTATS